MTKCNFSLLRKSLSEITVEPVLFLYMLSTFSQYALFQDLVYSKVCRSSYDASICDNLYLPDHHHELDIVQGWSSYWILVSTICLTVPSIFTSIYLGSWSDKFGRKWPVVIPPLGGVLSCLVYIVISFETQAPVGWICLASFLSGITGGFASCIMSSMTYVASISSEANRTTRISRLEAMIFLGGTMGPFISGSMVELTGHGYAFFFQMICYSLAFLYAVFMIDDIQDVSVSSTPTPSIDSCEQESRDKVAEQIKGLLTDLTASIEQDEKESLKSSTKSTRPSLNGHDESLDDETRNIILSNRRSDDNNDNCCTRLFGSQHFIDAVKTVFKRRDGNKRVYIILVILAQFIIMMMTAGELDVAYYFAKDKPLMWTHQMYSYYFGLKYGIGALVLIIGMSQFQRMTSSDATICIIGLISRIIALVAYGLSLNTTMAFIVPVLGAFSFFSIPATRALLSKLVSPTEHGKMFSFVAIMEDVCTMTASVVFNSVYPLTRSFFHGFVFEFAAGLLLIPLGIMWIVKSNLKIGKQCESSESVPSEERIL